MNKTQMLALAAVVAVLVVIVAAKAGKGTEPQPAADAQATLPAPEPMGEPPAEVASEPVEADDQTTGDPAAEGETAETASEEALPKLLELGSVGCLPCEHMAPIIEALEKELAGKVVVEFHDVGQNMAIAEKYQIMTIPTQVFLDAEGKELFRHIGVFEKEDILAKLKELGMLKE